MKTSYIKFPATWAELEDRFPESELQAFVQKLTPPLTAERIYKVFIRELSKLPTEVQPAALAFWCISAVQLGEALIKQQKEIPPKTDEVTIRLPSPKDLDEDLLPTPMSMKEKLAVVRFLASDPKDGPKVDFYKELHSLVNSIESRADFFAFIIYSLKSKMHEEAERALAKVKFNKN